MSDDARFTGEGGKFALAEALFGAHRLRIRCPECRGVAGRPGFIKDQAGKNTKDGLPHRYWKCQRSNRTDSPSDCSRQSCTEYINLARQQLTEDDFHSVVRRVCSDVALTACSRDSLCAQYLGTPMTDNRSLGTLACDSKIPPSTVPDSQATPTSYSSSSLFPSLKRKCETPDPTRHQRRRVDSVVAIHTDSAPRTSHVGALDLKDTTESNVTVLNATLSTLIESIDRLRHTVDRWQGSDPQTHGLGLTFSSHRSPSVVGTAAARLMNELAERSDESRAAPPFDDRDPTSSPAFESPTLSPLAEPNSFPLRGAPTASEPTSESAEKENVDLLGALVCRFMEAERGQEIELKRTIRKEALSAGIQSSFQDRLLAAKRDRSLMNTNPLRPSTGNARPLDRSLTKS